MYAISIICSAEVTLELVKQLSQPEILFDYSDARSVCFENKDNYLAVTDIDADATDAETDDSDFKVIDMYKGEQRLEILKHFVQPKVFLIQFVGFDLLKEFLDKISSLNIFIDNDQGKLLTAYDLLSFKKYQDFINSFTEST